MTRRLRNEHIELLESAFGKIAANIATFHDVLDGAEPTTVKQHARLEAAAEKIEDELDFLRGLIEDLRP